MLTVLTWFWDQPGGRAEYTPFNVNVWADSVSRNLAMPHRIACVTDIPEGLSPNIHIIKPTKEFEDWRIPTWNEARPQCLRRIAMFRRDAAAIFGERFVCMDLDCVIGDKLDPLFDVSDDFKIYEGTAPGRYYNGSMMLIRAGSRPQVYENFTLEGATEAGSKFVGSDQAWIAHCLGPNEATWGEEDGVHWWSVQSRTVREQAKIMFFPGSTKPWQVQDRWIDKHYRLSGNGRVLLLGYAQNVWQDVEEAVKYPFNGVIASPEAASHWPGDVLAIANDDEHAEQLARLHGFSEFVWCGKSEEV